MLNNPANKLCTDLQKERKIAKGQRKRGTLATPDIPGVQPMVGSGHSNQAPQPCYKCHLAARGKARMAVPPRPSATN